MKKEHGFKIKGTSEKEHKGKKHKKHGGKKHKGGKKRHK